jgi:restriction endonuclease S subunit
MDPRSLPLRRWDQLDDLPDGTSFTRTFKAGQVLFGKRRAYQRKVSLPDFDGVCSGDILVFEVSNGAMLPEFLPYVVQSDDFFEHALGTSAGSLSPRTKWQELAKYEFALPPIEEQRRISSVLGAVSALDAHLSSALQALVNLRESVFAHLPTSGIESPLGELLQSCDYGLSVVPELDGDVPILRMNNLEAGELNFEDLRWTSASAATDAYLVRAGDILFNRTNSLEHVGKVALVGELTEPMVFASYLLRLRVEEDRILPEYVAGFLQSAVGRRRISAFITLGVSQANVNATNLKKVLVPILSLENQLMVVERWKAIRSAQNMVTAHIARTRELMSAMRHRLLEASDVH